MLENINYSFLAPIKFFRLRYLAILIINIGYGIGNLTDIPYVFWTKNDLHLDAHQLIGISFWAFTPWTLKIVFAQFIEGLELWGNRRKSYIILASFISLLGAWIMVSSANNYSWVSVFGDMYNQIVISMVLLNSGCVIQDLIADTMCAELLDPNSTDKKQELGMIQFIARASVIFSVILATGIGGYLAHYFAYKDIIWISLLFPLIGFSSIFFLPKDVEVNKSQNNMDYKIIFISLSSFLVGVLSEKFSLPYAQEVLFLMNLFIIIAVFVSFKDDLSPLVTKEIISMGIIVFIFQSEPSISGYNPVGRWWQIDALGFDAKFLGVLSQVGQVFGFVGVWMLANYLTQNPISKTIFILTIVRAILFLPYLALAFGLHHWTMKNFGFGARSIMIFDAAVANYFDDVVAPVVLGLMAYYAPKRKLTTWFAMSASFLNLASLASVLNGRFLNHFFPVARGDYSNIPSLFVAKFFISLLLPLITIFLLQRFYKREGINS
jgi:hypothetical protein